MVGRIFKPGVTAAIAGVPVANLSDDGLRISFMCRRSMNVEPDDAELSIYNWDLVSRTTASTLWGELGRAKLEIRAGYDGVIKPLFRGDVRTLRPETLQGTDIVTFATADDAGDALVETAIQVPPGKYTAETMIQQAIALFAVPPPLGPGLVLVQTPSVAAALASVPAAKLSFGVVHIDKIADLLTEAARIIGGRWWIRDSQLFMSTLRTPTDTIRVVLPRHLWLTEPSEDGDGIVRLSTFMDSTITPGREVILVGRQLPGALEFFRVEECVYRGDTGRAEPWSVGMQLSRKAGL